MFIQLVQSNLSLAIVWIAAILAALTIHEFSHAFAGKLLGDQTAESMGRLTLNPIAHIDPFGFLALLLLGFGWARPVEFNPYNLRHPLRDGMFIALAGPVSNFLGAGIGGLALRALLASGELPVTNMLVAFLVLFVVINLMLGLFNLIPIHPLDGSKVADLVLDGPRTRHIRDFLTHRGPQILLFLVLVSFLSDINPFFFINGPAFLACDALVGLPCGGLLGILFNF